MFKTLITIFRGQAAQATENLSDANALVILDQQIRDSASALDRARRALAITMAQDATEVRRIENLGIKIADFETRATAALAGNREDLALEAAEAIANLESDKASADAAHASFLRESRKLQSFAKDAERRLSELERGRRAARAADAISKLRTTGVATIGGNASALKDAEATLSRLRQKQIESEMADNVLEALDGATSPDLIAEKLESAGFGEQTRPTAMSVMERLKQNVTQQTTA